MSVRVRVFDREGVPAGSFKNVAGFRDWRRHARRVLGKGLACGIVECDDVTVVDTSKAMGTLPAGDYEAILLQRMPLPAEARRGAKKHEFYMAI